MYVHVRLGSFSWSDIICCFWLKKNWDRKTDYWKTGKEDLPSLWLHTLEIAAYLVVGIFRCFFLWWATCLTFWSYSTSRRCVLWVHISPLNSMRATAELEKFEVTAQVCEWESSGNESFSDVDISCVYCSIFLQQNLFPHIVFNFFFFFCLKSYYYNSISQNLVNDYGSVRVNSFFV